MESTYSSRNRLYSGATAIWEKRSQYRTGFNSKNNGGMQGFITKKQGSVDGKLLGGNIKDKNLG